MIGAGSSMAEKAQLVREHSEKAVRTEMEGVPDSVPYTVLELVGKGSFGSVYKGIHNETKQVVAVKSLDLDQHDDEIKDIQKEIGLLSQLKAGDAPNITALHGSYQLDTRLWVIMDFCSGGSMRTLMKSGPIDEKYISIVVRETLLALGYLHKEGIIHRDIKAANILVSNEGKVQLCDFGVSAQLAGKNGKRQTFVGTPQWMAPEALTGAMYDSRIDIWSFGITIIEMAKQNPPLHHIQPHRVVDMIPRLPPPRLEGGTWSNALREFVAMCLNEIPDDRANVEELQRSKFVKASRAPTSVMRELIARYNMWEKSGGVRGSMLYAVGMANEQNGDTVGSDPGWDFDTIKSRISGVPQEWGMESRSATVKQPALMGKARQRGAAEGLYRLFNPDQARRESISDLRFRQFEFGGGKAPPPPPQQLPPPPQDTGFSTISIPSFDDDGIQVPEPVARQIRIPSMLPDPEPIGQIHIPSMPDVESGMGQIRIPSMLSDEDMQDEIVKAAERRAAAAAAHISVPPPPLAIASALQGNAAPDSPTGLMGGLQRSESTRSIARSIDSVTVSSPGPGDFMHSPRWPPMPASAPSSPPRVQQEQQPLLMPTVNGSKSYHLPSKSVPNIAGASPAPAPPIPHVNTTSTKPRLAGSTPHAKSLSQDITLRQGAQMQRQLGKNNVHKPSNLNLGPPNQNNFNVIPIGGILPPSPSLPNHTPQHSISAAGSTSTSSASTVLGIGLDPRPVVDDAGIPVFPAIEPLDTNVLMLDEDDPRLVAELDRMLTGLTDGLEVLQVGLKMLANQRSNGAGRRDSEYED